MMISGGVLFSNILTVTILGLLLLIVYLKMTNKTLVEFIKGMREAFSDRTEDVYNYVPHGFDNIR